VVVVVVVGVIVVVLALVLVVVVLVLVLVVVGVLVVVIVVVLVFLFAFLPFSNSLRNSSSNDRFYVPSPKLRFPQMPIFFYFFYSTLKLIRSKTFIVENDNVFFRIVSSGM
jgi:hypothetical protein